MTPATATADARTDIALGNRKFMEAFGRGDGAGIAALYTETGQLLPAHSDAVNGQTAIHRFWQGAIDAGLRQAMLETLETEILGDAAYEVGRYTLKADGGQVADSGKYVVIWKREGDSWKLHRDIWTTSRPAA
jgi:ketosteroid isomerase-like protein